MRQDNYYDDYGYRRKNKKIDRKYQKRRSIGGAVLRGFLLFLLSIFCIVVCIVAGAGIGLVASTPDINVMDVVPDEYPSHIYDRNGSELIELSTSGSNRQEAKYEEIPAMLKNAFTAIEDERFYQHNGVDIKGIFRAIYSNIVEGKDEGASTITQQLIKNNVIETRGRERSTGSLLTRKVHEWVMALELEKKMSKNEILTNYLNSINLGGGAYGVKAAAEFYFGKTLDELTLSECAVIAGITKNPTGNNPLNFEENNKTRQLQVLGRMKDLGYITEAEYNEAKADDVYARLVGNSTDEASIYTYFIDALLSEVQEDLEDAGYTSTQAYNLIFSGGLSIYSTQDQAIQNIIDEEINNPDNYPMDTSYGISWNMTVAKETGEYKYYSQRHIIQHHKNDLGETDYKLIFDTKEDADYEVEAFKQYILEEGDRITYEDIVYTLQPQVSFSMMDYTNGQVLALTGGRGDKLQNLSLNRATDTTRQPGSTFKVLAAFAPAMNSCGYTLATVHDDSPFSYEGDINREVHNWWGDYYRGLSNIRDGIRDSMNIIAVKTMYDIGADLSMDYLKDFGFKHLDEVEDATLSTALGGVSDGVTNLELCAAYSAIANEGEYIEPKLYTKIVARDGTVILEAEPETRQVIRPTVAALLTNAMIDVVEEGTGTLCKLNNAQLAGKTGTTSNDYDLWFAGYIPDGLCGTIWSGYDENTQIEDDEYHKEMYSTIMNRVVDELGYWNGYFGMPDGIVTATVCHKSGLLDNGCCYGDPTGKGPYTEYFEEGTVPWDYCSVHAVAYVCSDTGLLAGENCEGYYKTCIIRPPDIKGGPAVGYTMDSDYYYPYAVCDGTNHKEKEPETTTGEDDDQGDEGDDDGGDDGGDDWDDGGDDWDDGGDDGGDWDGGDDW